MRIISLGAAALAIGFLAGTAAPAAADPMFVPSTGPFTFVDAFFGGVYFGGGGDGRDGYPWNVSGPRPATTVGCYFTRARVDDRWRRVQVCY
jgi:hypothetical protein